ncbi:MAG: pseudouridine synthase [Pseudobdellovibrionaceae bacterium]
MSDPNLVRVSKLMSEKGMCSRREADEFIQMGLVYVDGEKITQLGTKVPPGSKVTLAPEAQKIQKDFITIMINKPIGFVSAQAEKDYKPAITLLTKENEFKSDPKITRTSSNDRINIRKPAFAMKKIDPQTLEGLAVIGRLDIDSTGLLIFTQDGRLAKQVIGEDTLIEKEYLVRIENLHQFSPSDLKARIRTLKNDLSLDEEKLKPCHVEQINEDQLMFILNEGKKRQIRRMCELVGMKVIGLKRVRVGNLKLGDLPVGKWRQLKLTEKI